MHYVMASRCQEIEAESQRHRITAVCGWESRGQNRLCSLDDRDDALSLYPVSHSDASQSRVSVSSRMRKRADSAVLETCHGKTQPVGLMFLRDSTCESLPSPAGCRGVEES